MTASDSLIGQFAQKLNPVKEILIDKQGYLKPERPPGMTSKLTQKDRKQPSKPVGDHIRDFKRPTRNEKLMKLVGNAIEKYDQDRPERGHPPPMALVECPIDQDAEAGIKEKMNPLVKAVLQMDGLKTPGRKCENHSRIKDRRQIDGCHPEELLPQGNLLV